jgi:hypothetical protein
MWVANDVLRVGGKLVYAKRGQWKLEIEAGGWLFQDFVWGAATL